MNKMKDWFPIEENVYATQKKVEKMFDKWYKENLMITRGKGRTVEEIFGFPYTSSSEYAGIWNAQAEAELKSDPQWKFNAVAITEDRQVVAVFEREDTGNFDEKEIVIGTI